MDVSQQITEHLNEIAKNFELSKELKRKLEEYVSSRKLQKTQFLQLLKYPDARTIRTRRTMLASFPMEIREFRLDFEERLSRMEEWCSSETAKTVRKHYPIRKIKDLWNACTYLYIFGDTVVDFYRRKVLYIHSSEFCNIVDVHEDFIATEQWYLTRVKRVQRAAKRWLELPKYPSGHVGYFARKSWEQACIDSRLKD